MELDENICHHPIQPCSGSGSIAQALPNLSPGTAALIEQCPGDGLVGGLPGSGSQNPPSPPLDARVIHETYEAVDGVLDRALAACGRGALDEALHLATLALDGCAELDRLLATQPAGRPR